jgi:hypothetical protein
MPPMQHDVNGDGVPDLAAAGTDQWWDEGYADVAGSIYFDVANLSGDEYQGDNADIIFYETMGGWGNSRINTALDINGDGYNEVIFSDYLEGNSSNGWGGLNYSSTCNSCGESAVYLFEGTDLTSGGEYILEDDFSARIYADSNWDYMGMSISGADLNGDGADEMLISSPGDDQDETNAGCVFIIEGDTSLTIDQIGEFELTASDFSGFGSIDGAAICSSESYQSGNGNGVRFSFNAIPQFADFNGDSVLDLAVAAPGLNKVYVFFDAGDLSGQLDPETDADVIIDGSAIGGWFGYSLTSGDFDGDGQQDLVIGAPDIQDPIDMIFDDDTLISTNTPGNNGMVYLFSGADMPASGSTVTEADASGAITSTGTDLFGMALNAADMNGDGKEDLWVGAPFYGNNYEGMLYYFASP